jgi:diguanylate cyclase (GGDEF)-like protein
MKHWSARTTKWLRAMLASDAAVTQAATLGNIQRLRWLIPVFLLVNLLLLTVFALDASPGTPVQLDWRQAVMRVYAVTAVVLLVLVLGTWRVTRRNRVDGWLRALQFAAPMVFLLFTIALTVLDQRVTPNISPYLLGCMSISLLFLLPPATAAWLFSIGYALFFVGIGLTQSDATLLLTNRGNGLGAAVLALVMAFGLWQRNTQYALLQRELTARNAALEKQQGELVWLATRDALTGLYNRGEFLRLAELELKRTQRHGGFTSAIVIDLDFFKTINDRHGHPAGDRVLAHVAQTLRGGVRATDVVARIGGEEFMILLPNTDIDAASVLSEKLRGLLHDSPAVISSELQIPVTGSFGVGCMPGGRGGTVASLYAAADNALYEAKRRGRDRVERTEPDPTLTPSDFQRMRA